MTDTWSSIPPSGHRHYIGGRFTDSTGDEGVDIVDPATEAVIATVPRATPDDARSAIDAARRAYDDGPWPHLSPAERSAALSRFAENLDARKDLLATIALRQAGAIVELAKSLQTAFPIHMARRYAQLAGSFSPIEHTELAGAPFGAAAGGRRTRVVQRVPAGVVTAITPFNYPLLVNVQKVFPAMAVGCPVVLKPTPTTCLDAEVMAEAADDAGIPPGVFSVLLGGDADVGEILVTDPRVDVITFTGSTTTGKRVMAMAADGVKRTLLELGGKSPNIVFADADLETWFATGPGNLRHAGQGCGQLTRILVERPIYDEVVDRLAADMSSLVVGPPDDPATEVGPLANKRQYDRVMGYIQTGIDEGARLVTGGGRPDGLDKGHYVQPTLFADVDNSMRIAREEIFGPVPVVIPFDGADAAVSIANDSDYGINASVWSGDDERARSVAGRILAGNVGVNCMANVTEGPHGGFKQTGIGREYWEWGMSEYVELRGLSLA